MRPTQILTLLTALSVLAVTPGCKSGTPAHTHTSGSLVDEPVEWTSKEREWLDGRTRADFQALMLHPRRAVGLERLWGDISDCPQVDDHGRIEVVHALRQLAPLEEGVLASISGSRQSVVFGY